MKRFQLKSLKSSDIVIGACLLCLVGFIASTYFWSTATPPNKVVVPVVVVPTEPQEEPQEEPQAAQEGLEAPQGKLSTPDTPTLAPTPSVLPVPPSSVIEIPVEVTIKSANPASSCFGGRCILRCRRGWFR